MVETRRFDPFNNRICRDVRNALSEGFMEALNAKTLGPVTRIATVLLADLQPAMIHDYIRRRLAAYERVLAVVADRAFVDPIDIALCIWDQGLFFETHEFLEPHWMDATGEEKPLFQALIRAAGTYVHLEQGNLKSAERMASKAIQGVRQYRARLAAHTDPERLLTKLSRLDPVPPVLSPD